MWCLNLRAFYHAESVTSFWAYRVKIFDQPCHRLLSDYKNYLRCHKYHPNVICKLVNKLLVTDSYSSRQIFLFPSISSHFFTIATAIIIFKNSTYRWFRHISAHITEWPWWLHLGWSWCVSRKIESVVFILSQPFRVLAWERYPVRLKTLLSTTNYLFQLPPKPASCCRSNCFGSRVVGDLSWAGDLGLRIWECCWWSELRWWSMSHFAFFVFLILVCKFKSPSHSTLVFLNVATYRTFFATNLQARLVYILRTFRRLDHQQHSQMFTHRSPCPLRSPAAFPKLFQITYDTTA